jgi:uncharacterized RDD family membrane protein YckC
MRGIKNLLIGLIGIIFIVVSLKELLIDNSDEYVKMIGATLFGLFLIYPIFKKDKTTDVEKFIKNQNIEVVIWWKRLIGFIIDYTVIILLNSVIAMLILPLITNLLNINNSEDIGLVFWVLFLLIFIFYYMTQEYFFKTTIGKLAFKLKIVSAKTNISLGSEKAKNPTLFQIFVRTIVRLLFFIDIFFFLFKRPIGLHDIISKTIVIEK